MTAAAPVVEGGAVGNLRLVGHQARYDLISFWRNPQSRFFTLVLPILFLIIFVSVFGNHPTRVDGHTIKQSVYYVPGIATLAVIAASLVNLVISIVAQRENGVLKRRRAAPVPAWVLIAGRALTSVLVAMVTVAVIVAIGRIAYGVHVRPGAFPAIVIAVAVGSAAFCCIAFAMASFISSEDSAQPIVQATMLPLYFISGVFITDNALSATLKDIAGVFPVRHLDRALFKAFDPTTTGAGISGKDLLILAAWGAGSLIIALWRFSWSPRSA